MSVEENKAIVRRFTNEVLNMENIDLADELITPDFVAYTPSNQYQGHAYTAQALKEGMVRVHSGYANLQYTIEDMIAEGDKVVACATARGIHEGDVMTRLGKASATGKEITYAIMFIYRLADGKIVDFWEYYDDVARLQQLGVLPE